MFQSYFKILTRWLIRKNPHLKLRKLLIWCWTIKNSVSLKIEINKINLFNQSAQIWPEMVCQFAIFHMFYVFVQRLLDGNQISGTLPTQMSLLTRLDQLWGSRFWLLLTDSSVFLVTTLAVMRHAENCKTIDYLETFQTSRWSWWLSKNGAVPYPYFWDRFCWYWFVL